MKEIKISVQGMELDYNQAKDVARALAGSFDKEPTVVAWYDAHRHLMSPVIEGGDQNRWHDYGEANGGNISIDVNGDFDFIFADSTEFEGLGRSPYVAVQDKTGKQYLCLLEELRDPNNPQQEACYALESSETMSALHEG